MTSSVVGGSGATARRKCEDRSIKRNGGQAQVAIALAIAACVLTATSGAERASATRGETAVAKPSEVTSARMATWVKRLVGFGIRRPGYAADNAAARWIETEFKRAGLKHVHRDPVRVNRWKPKTCRVTWWRTTTPHAKTTSTCFALPFSQPRANLTATVVLDDGKNDIKGSIGVVDDQFVEIPQSVLAQQALDVVAPTAWVDTDQQPIPFGIRNGDLFSDFFGPTVTRGGVGMIGILDGLGVDRYYAPYTGTNVDLPAVWLGQAAGKRLTAAMAAGPTTATITCGRPGGPRRPAMSSASFPRRRTHGSSSARITTLRGRRRSRTPAASPRCSRKLTIGRAYPPRSDPTSSCSSRLRGTCPEPPDPPRCSPATPRSSTGRCSRCTSSTLLGGRT